MTFVFHYEVLKVFSDTARPNTPPFRSAYDGFTLGIREAVGAGTRNIEAILVVRLGDEVTHAAPACSVRS
ncbi:hypothetical protein MA5S0422_2811 [Mycobacteroides abscessus 5S-0422]|uniref:Uncharacterized protein n=1 Tax=Mycobacteroides abscessus subsp. bolletii 1513 TaxID=1299321 RepID=X8DTD5_9MYCO|nr:hypothetical protein MA5S0304_1875 [Mycobacteroides abscessus 5S-0304]EIU12788.1 hypothetical protein MA5S0421_2128 [Mycobacteroides abscessus 5S-0421]EIU13456.1 hypothetical protein MA5S0422_2811 [Mycobacteroides abscessus 5S-0422]EIU21810.1 hypothetical protein MA5S0708_4896 [Mycobacteroides abscessus 5S-0708]EIU24181.1 hypothetical protein MA5S0817_5155 [Mycobacteroides abscessus 5S-0817]EIU30747.1 hypothetical protein MA5S1212_4543 [Mycobacteroides abscessus 5S-1212]EIU42379.1 hypothet